MDVDTTQIKGMAERLRRQTRQAEVLALCDAVLAWREVAVVKPIVGTKATPCPVCVARRQAKALAMKKWRGKSNRSNESNI